MISTDRTARLLGAAAAGLVGSSVAAASVLTSYPALAGQGVRYAVSSLLLVGYARVRGHVVPRPSARDLVWLCGVAATGMAAFNVVLIRATAHTDASVVGVVVGAAPVVLAVLGPLIQRTRPTPRVLFGAVVVVAGAVLVEQAGGRVTITGLTLAVTAMLGEVCFSLLAVPPLRRLGALGVSVHATWLAAVMLGVASLLFEGGRALVPPTLGEVVALAHMAITVTAVAFVFWYSAVDRLGAERAGLLLGFIPVVALLTSAAVGTDRITADNLLGVVVVASGIVIGSTRSRARPGAATASPAPGAEVGPVTCRSAG